MDNLELEHRIFLWLDENFINGKIDELLKNMSENNRKMREMAEFFTKQAEKGEAFHAQILERVQERERKLREQRVKIFPPRS